MKFWERLRQLDDPFKKVIIFCLIAVLAVPLFWLVRRNFSNELNSFDKQKFYQILKLDKLRQAKDSVFSQTDQQEKDFTEGMQELQEMAKQQAPLETPPLTGQATSTVATSSDNATSTY